MILVNEKFKFSMIDNLMFSLTSEIISLYEEENNWLSVRKIAIEKNFAQKNAVSSRERYVVEVLFLPEKDMWLKFLGVLSI